MEQIKTVGTNLAFVGAGAAAMVFCLLGALMLTGIEWDQAWNAIGKTFIIFTVYSIAFLFSRKH
ncbi:MAG: hypothetical protein IT292_06380 [Deltaproteobacteria bacterium]|nr:hypothetical protein [Deltaproteobacteria bacterium]